MTTPFSVDGETLWSALESAAEEAGIGVYVAQLDVAPPRIVYVSRRAAEIVGYTSEQLVGQVPWIMVREEDRAIVRATIDRPTGAPAATLELVVQRPDGRQIPITLASTRMQTPAGLLAFGYFRDLTNERQMLQALRQSEARFRFLVETAPDGVVILKRGVIVFINPRAAQLLGVAPNESAIGRPIASFLPPEDAAATAERIGKMLREGVEFPPSEYRVLADPTRVVEIKSTVCEWDGGQAVLALARDVTERKAIERRLIETDRLAALGTLAAGVAHEINNPLTYARLSTDRIRRILHGVALPADVEEQLKSHLGDIEHGISRVASITQSLRGFVSHDGPAVTSVDLGSVIARSLKMVDNELRHAAALVYEPANVPAVRGVASQLEQVFVNVFINAIRAMPADPTKSHELRIRVSADAEQVTVAITDTGTGIPANLRSRIFDPFFSTREVGHGMGLGLSVSKTIIDKLGGSIDVDSTEGAGTTVRVRLPVYSGAAQPSLSVAHAPSTTGRRRILVIDDEPMICSALERMLSPAHDVETASSGAIGIERIRQVPFDVIICDLMMPGMNGPDVYHRVARVRPGLERRIAFMSGGSFGDNVDADVEALPNMRLGKPFTIEQVFELVAQVSRR